MSKITNDIDAAGELKARIADLKVELAQVEARIKKGLSTGMYEEEGDLFRAVYSTTTTTRVDWQAIAGKLNPSRQLVAAHTKVVHGTRLTISARKT